MTIRSVRHFRALAVMWLLAHSSASYAESVTLWVKGYPITREGNLVGCALEFNVAAQDYIYRQGRLSSLVGSITFNKADDPTKVPFYVGYKLIVRDLDGDNAVPNPPTSIHLVGSDGTIWKGDPKRSFPSDTQGGLNQLLLPEDAMVRVFKGILETKSVVLAFNRRPGGTDVRVPLDLTVESSDLETKSVKRSDEAVAVWTDCTGKLFKLEGKGS